MTNGSVPRDLSAEVAQVSAERLSKEQVRAEAATEAVEAEYQRVLARLQEEFGVSSAEAAAALLAQSDQEVLAELTIVRQQLSETGVP